MQNRQNAARYLKDAGKALLLGLAAAAAVFAVLFLVGALALLVSAGALLLPEKAASVREKEGWNARFSCLGLFGVLFCVAVVILAAGSLLDALLFRLV